MSGAVKSVYEIEAAWVRLSPLMEQFGPGSDIDDAWVLDKGGVEPARLENRIRRFFYKRDIPSRRRGTAIHLLTAAEHAELPTHREQRAERQHKRGYHEGKTVDRSKLDSATISRVDRSTLRHLAHLESAEKGRREEKVLTGVPVPNPRPRLVG